MRIPNLDVYVATGEPILPMKTIQVLIPANTEVKKVEVNGKNEVFLGNYIVEPGQQPIALCCNEELPLTKPNKAIYNSNKPFPEKLHKDIGIQKLRGYEILVVNLFPVKYIPKSGELSYYKEITLTVSLEPIKKPEKLFRNNPKDKNAVKSKVDNPSDTDSYTTSDIITTASALVDPAQSYDYVIITNNALKNAAGAYTLQDLVDFKNSKGISTVIVTTEEILAEPDYYCDGAFGDGCTSKFNDTQARIRNFIKDAYQNWEIEYVLLAGDGDGADVGYESGDNIIPARKFIAYKGEMIPADMYYSNLDGNFDNDGDGIFGETRDGVGGGEVDLYAEVYIGRAPLDSAQEASNFVRKTLAYETSGGSYLDKAWMVGEHLDFGGDSEYAGGMKDEVKDGTDAHGYTTVGFPEEFNVFTLYDRDWPTHDWPKEELVSIINDNIHIINHLGHASTCYVMKLCNSPYDGGGPCPVGDEKYGKATDVDDLTNDEFLFAYSQGCFPGSFDNWNYKGYYTTCDSIAEHFVTSENGAFAMIANSRSGWGRGYSTDGPSQRFDRQFWDAVFGEEITEISKANQDSKEDNIGSIGDSVIRYCYYTINLFGDPTTSFKMKKIDITINTNKIIYDPGETILVTGTIEGESGPINADLEIYFFNPQGIQLDQVTTTSPAGSYSTTFTIPANGDPGNYEIRVDATYVGMSASRSKKVKVGSLTIDLSPTEVIIPFNTNHTIEGYVYDGAQQVENANITAYAIKDGIVEETLTTTTDIDGYFDMQWLPDDYGKYDIEVIAKAPITNKAGKEEIEIYVTPPAPGTLRVYLRDAQNNYIYDSNCPYAGAEHWYDIRITVYDESEEVVASENSPTCQEGFNITPGTYNIIITGSTTFEQDPYTFIDQEVIITTGSYVDVDLSGDGKLHTILKNPNGDYMYDVYSRGCPYPAEEWYDIKTSIFKDGERKIHTYDTRCLEGYYLIPGTYTVKIEGKLTLFHPFSTLLEKEITINSGDVINLTTEDLAMINVIMKDTEGEYLRDRFADCQYPSTSWHSLSVYIYNETGGQLIYSYSADCIESYYLQPGVYIIKIQGRATSNQNSYTLLTKQIELLKGQSVDITLESLAKLKVELRDAEDNYIHDRFATCPYPSTEWNSIYTYIYNSSGGQIIYTYDTGCTETYYLAPGTYAVDIKGRATTGQNDFFLLNQQIQVNAGEIKTLTLESSAKLRIILEDAFGNYIHDRFATCPYPSTEWNNIYTYIYNSSGQQVIYTYNTGCLETYYLDPGTYTVEIIGRTTSDQDTFTLLYQQIELAPGEIMNLTLQDTAKLDIILIDAEDNYIHDRFATCPYPSTEWNNIYTYIYNSSGGQVMYTYNTGCLETYYLLPGNYTVEITGRATNNQNTFTLLSQQIQIMGGERINLTLKSVAILKIILKDAQANYLYDRYATCPYSGKSWYDLYTYLYNSSGDDIIYTFNTGCVEKYYAQPGTYEVEIGGRAHTNQNTYTLLKKPLELIEGQTIIITLEDLAILSIWLKDAQETYIYDKYATCSRSGTEWYNIYTYIYNSSGDDIIYASNTGCTEDYYLAEGTYKILTMGEIGISQQNLPLIQKTIQLEEGEVSTLITTDMALFGVIVKDNNGNYLYGRYSEGCSDTPNKEYYSLNIYVYNSTDQIAYSPSRGCFTTFGLPEGTYNITIQGRETISDPYKIASDKRFYEESRICIITVNIDTNSFSFDCYKAKNTMMMPLQEGWNLVSIPFVLEDDSVSSVFSSVDYLDIFAYDSDWYVPTKINNTMGVWIRLINDGNLTIEGYKPQYTSIPIHTGWNLIGYPKYLEMLPENTFQEINYSAAYCYEDVWKSHVKGRPSNSLEKTGPGYGIWINSNENTELIFEELS